MQKNSQNLNEFAVKLKEASDLELIKVAGEHPTLNALLNSSSGVREGYTVKEHVGFALAQYAKYSDILAQQPKHYPHFMAKLSRRDLGIMMLIHDLDKCEAGKIARSSEKQLQHQRTLGVINSLYQEGSLPLSSAVYEIVKELIASDAIGKMFKSIFNGAVKDYQEGYSLYIQLSQETCSLEHYQKTVRQWQRKATDIKIDEKQLTAHILTSASEIKDRARRLDISPAEFFWYQSAYFQLDSSAYTWDACFENNRAIPSLDYIYKTTINKDTLITGFIHYDRVKQRLSFGPRHEEIFAKLEAAVLAD